MKLSERTIKRLEKLAMKGCGDPGYGGCMPRCDSCKAKEQLRNMNDRNDTK